MGTNTETLLYARRQAESRGRGGRVVRLTGSGRGWGGHSRVREQQASYPIPTHPPPCPGGRVLSVAGLFSCHTT